MSERPEPTVVNDTATPDNAGAGDALAPDDWFERVNRRVGLTRHDWLLPVADGPSLRLPIVRMRRGAGPRVLVAGGTHGDETEGQLAASALAGALGRLDVRGEIVVLPRHNPLACRAGTRRAPEDGLDLNRQYPGRDDGEASGAAAAIAAAVTRHLLPGLDWLVDLHSGGTTHEFVPSSNLQAAVGGETDRALRPALAAFGAPWAILFDDAGGDSMPHAGTLEAAAAALGARAVSSELGGGARTNAATLALAERGLIDLLVHAGALGSMHASGRRVEPRYLALFSSEHYLEVPADALFVPSVALGADVAAGDPVGCLHPIEHGGAAGLALVSPITGTVVALACRALLRAGETAAMIAVPA